jgi:hypothetical protein
MVQFKKNYKNFIYYDIVQGVDSPVPVDTEKYPIPNFVTKIIEIPKNITSKGAICGLIEEQIFSTLKFRFFEIYSNYKNNNSGHWDRLNDYLVGYPRDLVYVSEQEHAHSLMVIFHYDLPNLDNPEDVLIYLEIMNDLASNYSDLIESYNKYVQGESYQNYCAQIHGCLVYFPSSAKEQIEKILSEEN